MDEKRSIKKRIVSILMLIISIIYVIIGNYEASYAEEVSNVAYKKVKYAINGPITGNTYIYDICVDALKYHVKANGYDKKYGDECTNNFINLVKNPVEKAKIQGYGKYTLKLTGLEGLLNYINLNDGQLMKSCVDMILIKYPECSVNKLIEAAKKTLNTTAKDWMSIFWDIMNTNPSLFEEYQDAYFFKNYTYKALDKIYSTLTERAGIGLKNLSNTPSKEYEKQSSKEYLTLLTTYVYSINREEQLSTIGRGDLVPFLYYAEHTGCRDPKEIAKYAYVALCGEFLRVSGTNYWKNEFNDIFNLKLEESELTETENFSEWVNERQEYDEGLKQNDQFTNEMETLEEWYDETYEKYRKDRGAKQNPLLGSDINTIVASEYTIKEQVEATKMYIQSVYDDLGIEMDINEHIARNELMAKYMMENSHIADTIEDYCVEISFVEDNLQRGTYEEKNGTTAVLSDFQVIDFKKPIESAKKEDRDKDGLTNENELGEIKWIDVTSFLRKTYNEKLGKGEIVGTFEEHIKKIQEANGYYPDNPNSGHVQVEKDNLGNILSVKYRTYDYKSNPALKDSDFDGIDDKPDYRPLSGAFQGQTDIERSGKLNVDYTNDFRYFFIDNNKYNDELAQMSLIISNLATDAGRKIDLSQGGLQVGRMNVGGYHVGDLNIVNYLDTIGFSSFGNESLYGGEGKVYLCQKVIDYYAERDDKNNLISGEEKLVIGIFIGGFESEKSYKELVVDTDKINNNYEEIINQIVERINNIKSTPAIKTYIDKDKYCYWITGKNISGAVANGVASKLQDKDHTYCYAFASPNVGINVVGSYVKNIINADDLLPKINSDDYSIGGNIYNKSIYWDLIPEYREYIGNLNNYKGNYKKTNRIKKGLENVDKLLLSDSKNVFISDIVKYLYRLIGKEKQEVDDRNVFIDTRNELSLMNLENDDIIKMIDYKEEVTAGNSTKAYWCLAKSINGYDERYYYEGSGKKQYSEVANDAPKSEEVNTDEEKELKDPRNGYPYNCNKDYYISDKNYNNSKEDTVMIKPFMYSNYTLDGKKVEYKDINYVKFWYSGNKNIPTNKNGEIEQLYKYHAGDMSQSTHCTYGSYKDKKYVKKYGDYGGEVKVDERLSLGHNKGNLVTINNRIIAAFPSALFNESFNYNSEFEKSREILNKWESYNIDTIDETGKNGGSFRGASIVAKEKDMYKLVDVVIEDENGQQFVVPFIVIDPKDIHFLPNYKNNEGQYYNGISKMGMYSTLTDNRYGQVMERIKSSNPKSYKYHKYYSNVLNQEVWFNDREAKIANEDIEKGNATFIDMNKVIIYYDRDEEREAVYISPIEPYINDGESTSNISKIMTNLICGKGILETNPSCKIVSMRVYDERCAEDDGTPIEGTWEKRQEEIQKNTEKKLIEVRKDKYNSIEEYFNDFDNKREFEKVVNY